MSPTRRITVLDPNVFIDRRIGDAHPPFVIAEIGHNHGGNLDTCMRLFQAAAQAGAHAVKLQKRTNRALFTAAAFDQPYHSENAYGATYGAHREALEFSEREFRALDRCAYDLGLTFFSTAFDPEAADFLAQNTRCPAFKIASGDLTNTPLLAHVAQYGKPIILSTGGGSLEDVDRAIATIGTRAPVAVLHCTAEYPCPPEHLDLRVIETYRDRYPGLVVGLSSHFDGILDAPLAYQLGARIFEKHFTLSRGLKGSDHRFSLTPEGLRKLCRDLERTPLMLGSAEKVRRPEEAAPLTKMAKSLYAARDLPAGHVLQAEDVLIRTPGGGVPPWKLDRLIGMTLPRSVAAEELLSS